MTLFSKIYNGEIPSEIIYEDEYVFAINDISPIAPIHVLVIPKEEIATINDVNPTNEHLLGKIVLAAKHIAAEKGLSERGYRLVFNCNADAGQSIFHIHCHLIGGKQLNWGA
ncbi:MAG: histidine triad nucleotide-binding protein [Ignavibacteria bacterium]|jgi:histidine triad (HIT) family protein|nr:histidine triad nucleotide-binding protein [Ignavibacteria bacterium]